MMSMKLLWDDFNAAMRDEGRPTVTFPQFLEGFAHTYPEADLWVSNMVLTDAAGDVA